MWRNNRRYQAMPKHTHIPEYTIITQIFEGEQTVLRLQKLGTDDVIETTARAVSLNTALVKALSSQDAHLVGYISATDALHASRQQRPCYQQ